MNNDQQITPQQAKAARALLGRLQGHVGSVRPFDDNVER
jgi:hypothetical protein